MDTMRRIKKAAYFFVGSGWLIVAIVMAFSGSPMEWILPIGVAGMLAGLAAIQMDWEDQRESDNR